MSGALRFIRGASPVIVAGLLAGCTAKPPVEAYRHPVEQFVYGPDGYCLPEDCQPARTPASISAAPANVPGDWIYSREKGGYYAPPPNYPQPAPAVPAPGNNLPRVVARPAPAAPAPQPYSYERPSPPIEHPWARTPEPVTQPDPPVAQSSQPAPAPEPYRPAPAAFKPPPLIDIEKSPPATGASPDDACVGAWRICHFF